jgi:hypothetical protein
MQNPPPSLDKLERALAYVAAVVVRYGEAYAPILERLEREVEAARSNGATARARRILDEYRRKGAAAEPIRLAAALQCQINDDTNAGSSI